MSVSYTVQPQDTLTRIAASLSSGICDIARASRIENVDLIFPNQTLTVPVKVANPDNASCLITNTATATCVSNGPATYTVQTNDTFKSIAMKLGITTESLQGANPGVDQYNLVQGNVLNVPVCGASSGSSPGSSPGPPGSVPITTPPQRRVRI